MSLMETLRVDLERQYHFAGQTARRASNLGILLGAANPRFVPVILTRISHYLYTRKLGLLAKVVSLLNFVVFGLEIGAQCEIGPGLYFPHTVGTVIGALRIGRNAVIYHQVTIGAKELDLGFTAEARPVVGDNVVIGSGAKVLGGITVGNNVKVGANAVVLKSVPDDVLVGGVPACVLRQH
jgi:serine O-acetyltransferase